MSGNTPSKNAPKHPHSGRSVPSTPHIRLFLAPLAPFSPLPPSIPHLATLSPSETKKRGKAATSPPFLASGSTKFNFSPFNLHPKLNTRLNRIKPKFNPLQPFAHFVLSRISPRITSNSLIFSHSTLFRFFPTLYISFSCPYQDTSS